MKDTYLEEPGRRAPVDAQRLSQGIVDRGVVVAKFLPQRLLGLGLVDRGVRCPGAMQQLLRLRDGDGGRGRCDARRWRLGVMCWTLRHHAVVLPHHQHLGRTLGGWPRTPPRSAPPGGGIIVNRGLHRPAAPDGPAPRTSLPTPLVRVVGD
jgi:hypothetical protein